MISELFNTLYQQVLNLLALVLPTSAGLPSNVATGIDFIVAKLFSFNFILPVNTMIQILQYVLFIEVAIFFFKFIKFILNLVRGSGG